MTVVDALILAAIIICNGYMFWTLMVYAERLRNLQDLCSNQHDRIQALTRFPNELIGERDAALETLADLDDAVLCACNALRDSIACSGNDPETNIRYVAKLKSLVVDRETSADIEDSTWLRVQRKMADDMSRVNYAPLVSGGVSVMAEAEAFQWRSGFEDA